MPGDEHEVMLIPKPQNIRNGRNAANVVSQTAAAPQLFIGCLLVLKGGQGAVLGRGASHTRSAPVPPGGNRFPDRALV